MGIHQGWTELGGTCRNAGLTQKVSVDFTLALFSWILHFGVTVTL